MKRRTFLRAVGATGGAALASRLARAAARPAALDKLKQARIAVVARAASPAAGAAAEVSLAAGLSARRDLRAGTLALRAAPVAGGHDSVDLFVSFRAKAGAPAGTINLALDFGAWSVDNYVLLPGACYAGNRFASRFVGYPPLLTEPADIGPHVPPIVTDIPRLTCTPDRRASRSRRPIWPRRRRRSSRRRRGWASSCSSIRPPRSAAAGSASRRATNRMMPS